MSSEKSKSKRAWINLETAGNSTSVSRTAADLWGKARIGRLLADGPWKTWKGI